VLERAPSVALSVAPPMAPHVALTVVPSSAPDMVTGEPDLALTVALSMVLVVVPALAPMVPAGTSAG